MNAFKRNSKYNGRLAGALIKVAWAMKKLRTINIPAMIRLAVLNPGTWILPMVGLGKRKCGEMGGLLGLSLRHAFGISVSSVLLGFLAFVFFFFRLLEGLVIFFVA